MPAFNEIDYWLSFEIHKISHFMYLSSYGHNYTENRWFHFEIKIHVGIGMISKWREGWSHGREGVEYGCDCKLVSVGYVAILEG